MKAENTYPIFKIGKTEGNILIMNKTRKAF